MTGLVVLLVCCAIAVWRPIWGLAILLAMTSSLFHLHQYAYVPVGMGYLGIADAYLPFLLLGAWLERRRYLRAKAAAAAAGAPEAREDAIAAAVFSRRTLISAIAPLLVWQLICSAIGIPYWWGSPMQGYALRLLLIAVLPWILVATVYLLRHEHRRVLRVVVGVAVVTALVHLALQLLDLRALMEPAYWFYVEETEYLRDQRLDWVYERDFVRGSPQGILLITYVAIFWFARFLGSPRARPALLAGSAVLMLAVLITLTRALLVQLVVGCGLAALLWLWVSLHQSSAAFLQRAHRLAGAGILVVLALLVMAIVRPGFFEAWGERLASLAVEKNFLSEESDTIRGEDNAASLRAIADSPLVGWGIARYPQRYAPRGDLPPDNIQPLLMLALSGGVLNVVLALRLLLLILYRFARQAFSRLDLFGQLIPFFVLIVAMLVLNITGGGGTINGTFQGVTLTVSAILIGLMAARYVAYFEEPQLAPARVALPILRRRRPVLAVPTMLFVMLAPSGLQAGQTQPPRAPQTYYISSSEGDDGNSGRSASAAWRTLARLRSAELEPGAVVLLRRGDVWRETLELPRAGRDGLPLVVTGYGTGDRPALRGSDLVTSWTQWSGTVWRAQLQAEPAAVFFDGERGTRAPHLGAVEGERSWWADGPTLYVASDGNPAIRYRAPGVEVAVRDHVVSLAQRSHVVLRGLDVRHGREAGIRVHRSERVRIEDCVAADNYGNGILVDGTNPYSHGVTIDRVEVIANGGTGVQIVVGPNMGVRDAEVTRSTISRNGWSGAANAHGIFGNFEDGRIVENVILENGGSNPAFEHGIYIFAYGGQRGTFTISDNRIAGHAFGNGIKVVDASGTITRNRIEGNAYEGIGCHDAPANGYGVDITFNVIAGNHNGIREAFANASGKTLRVVNNTLFRNPIVVLSQNLRSLVILNNIIVSPTNFAYEIARQANATVDHNAVVTAHPSYVAWYDRRPRELTDWQQALGFDRHGFNGDPQMNDPAAGDFSLRAGSRAIDAGRMVEPASALDFNRNPVPAGAAPDMGALEHRQ